MRTLIIAVALAPCCAPHAPPQPGEQQRAGEGTQADGRGTYDCAERVSVIDAGVAPFDAASVAAPIDAGAGDAGERRGRGLPPEPIRRVMVGNFGAFQCCFENQLREGPDGAGEIVLAFQVGADGLVASASVSSNSVENPKFATCMLDVCRHLKFPAAELPTNVSFPFVFGGQR